MIFHSMFFFAFIFPYSLLYGLNWEVICPPYKKIIIIIETEELNLIQIKPVWSILKKDSFLLSPYNLCTCATVNACKPFWTSTIVKSRCILACSSIQARALPAFIYIWAIEENICIHLITTVCNLKLDMIGGWHLIWLNMSDIDHAIRLEQWINFNSFSC